MNKKIIISIAIAFVFFQYGCSRIASDNSLDISKLYNNPWFYLEINQNNIAPNSSVVLIDRNGIFVDGKLIGQIFFSNQGNLVIINGSAHSKIHYSCSEIGYDVIWFEINGEKYHFKTLKC
jgi:hypothetical protein